MMTATVFLLLVCLSLILATSTRFKRFSSLRFRKALGGSPDVGPNTSSNQLVSVDSAVNNLGQGIVSRRL
ncbi:unnamed protein product [Leptidea sinapis]|uniref:Uncharacterized protein n=1 Tax=Leptidea sinapis TaxID=189913 RepID=A0A5E4QWI2_9NEOP|nr:unnamed protein product [Leptidea sinapis]